MTPSNMTGVLQYLCSTKNMPHNCVGRTIQFKKAVHRINIYILLFAIVAVARENGLNFFTMIVLSNTVCIEVTPFIFNYNLIVLVGVFSLLSSKISSIKKEIF